MFYWLFTEGRAILSGLILPLSCLTLSLPLLTSAILGAGIQRSGQAHGFSGWKRGAKLLTHLIVLLGVTALYIALVGDAGNPAAARQADCQCPSFVPSPVDRTTFSISAYSCLG